MGWLTCLASLGLVVLALGHHHAILAPFIVRSAASGVRVVRERIVGCRNPPVFGHLGGVAVYLEEDLGQLVLVILGVLGHEL